MRRLAFASLLSFAASEPAEALDWVPPVIMPQPTFSGMVDAMNTSIMVDAIGRKADEDTASASRPVGRLNGSHKQSLAYVGTPAVAASARSDFLERLRKKSSSAASLVESQMRAHDFGQVYTGIVAPFGLRRGDAGDAITAYTLLGWMIATGATDPTATQVRALRANIGATMSADPRFASEATRAALGEELVISFVTLHAGWQSARREGKLQQYSDGVAAMFRKQTGNDLRSLVLTDRGLERQG